MWNDRVGDAQRRLASEQGTFEGVYGHQGELVPAFYFCENHSVDSKLTLFSHAGLVKTNMPNYPHASQEAFRFGAGRKMLVKAVRLSMNVLMINSVKVTEGQLALNIPNSLRVKVPLDVLGVMHDGLWHPNVLTLPVPQVLDSYVIFNFTMEGPVVPNSAKLYIIGVDMLRK